MKEFTIKAEPLLRCPFCGGEAQLQQIPSATWDKFVVTCKSSKCCAFYIGYCDEGLYDTRTKAVEAWNTRKPMERILERLEKGQEECYKLFAIGFNAEDRAGYDAYSDAIEIVKEEGGIE